MQIDENNCFAVQFVSFQQFTGSLLSVLHRKRQNDAVADEACAMIDNHAIDKQKTGNA